MKEGEVYRLAERALDGIGEPGDDTTTPVQSWEDAAERLGTAGAGDRRRARHAAQREHWRKKQERHAENRKANTDRRHLHAVDPALVQDDGLVVDPVTGEVIDGLYVATDGQWIWHQDDPDHDTLTIRAAAAVEAYQAA